MISREEAKKKHQKGWADLIDRIYDLVEGAGSSVELIKNKMGWLRVNARLDDRDTVELLNLEKESNVTCMHCGRYGRLAKDYTILCFDCEDLGVFLRHGHTVDPASEP